MLQKSEGIVLRSIKHSESGIISQIFTKDSGSLAFIAKGVHNKKSNTPKVYFQPLQILNIEFYFKEKNNLHTIKEVSSAFSFSNIPYDITKSSFVLFFSEVLYKTIKDTGSDIPLYNFLIQTLKYLDKSDFSNSNFHIGFMISLAKYLGIAPDNSYSPDYPFFDMQNGIFTSTPPLHGYYMDKEFSRMLNSFLNIPMQDCHSIKLSGSLRTEFLNSILTFYSFHLPGTKNIHSLEVFSEIFT